MSCTKCISDKCTCETTVCLNPLIYFIKEAFALVGSEANSGNIGYVENIMQDISVNYTHVGNTYDLPLALIQVLNRGLSVSNNKTLCCPDCDSDTYALGGRQNLLDVANGGGDADIPVHVKLCCIEHNSSVQSWNAFKEDYIDIWNYVPDCCETDFQDASKLWIQASTTQDGYFYLFDIMLSGIYESSSFNGMSGLGILYNYLQTMHPDFTAVDYLSILGIITSLGLVVKCNGCEMLIGGSDAANGYFYNRA
jgi:hypothetical protein